MFYYDHCNRDNDNHVAHPYYFNYNPGVLELHSNDSKILNCNTPCLSYFVFLTKVRCRTIHRLKLGGGALPAKLA